LNYNFPTNIPSIKKEPKIAKDNTFVIRAIFREGRKINHRFRGMPTAKMQIIQIKYPIPNKPINQV
jgi:hypothetical protein